ncbi:MAG: hypothetical protein ACTSVI_17635 [Promethearchaeota archaeon]
MKDPESTLSFRLKRQQFNNRIPVQLHEMFNDFGNDRKYLLEYLLWVACKYLGTSYSRLDELNVKLLETYFDNVKNILKNNEKYGQEFSALFSVESELMNRLNELQKRKAYEFASGNKEKNL